MEDVPPDLTGGEAEVQAHNTGHAMARFLHESFSLATWALVTPEMGPHDAPILPEAALPSPALVAPDFLRAPVVGFKRQMPQPLHLAAGPDALPSFTSFHCLQPEEREGEATGQIEPRSQCPLPPLCSVGWKLDHEVYRNWGP